MKETHTLKLKDIAPYYQHGLIGHATINKLKGKIVGLHGVDYVTLSHSVNDHNTVNDSYLLSDFIPYLRPLSDLTKEIEVNGKRFVPSKVIGINENHPNYETFIRDHNSLTYNEVQMMISLHFDVFGLINKGLAINLNTITNG